MESLSYYPIAFRRGPIGKTLSLGCPKRKFILLSYYPIRFRGYDRINSPFGRPKGKVYPMILLPYLFQGARYDKPSFWEGMGSPGKFILLSYFTIWFRGRRPLISIYPIILAVYREYALKG